jgi:hypothetical protein
MQLTDQSDPLPMRPDDGYDWDRFFGDQDVPPSIFHGTSTIFADSIKRHGLARGRIPYRWADIERVVRIFGKYTLCGPKNRHIAGLEVFTRTTSRHSGWSLCFDWERVCRTYAIGYRGGETLEHLLCNVVWALDKHRDTFLPDEIQFMADLRDKVLRLVAEHRPMVVSFAFNPDWFDQNRIQNILDRDEFLKQDAELHLFGGMKSLYLGSHGPGGIVLNGAELVTLGDVPTTSIRAIYVLEPDAGGSYSLHNL